MLRPAVTIDASMTLRDALAALAEYPSNASVVIRRRTEEHLYWYAKRIEDIRSLTKKHPPESHANLSLAIAFKLREPDASLHYQISELPRSEREAIVGVLLDGEHVVGVGEPRSQKAIRFGGRAGPEATPFTPPSPAPHPPRPGGMPADSRERSTKLETGGDACISQA